MRRYAIPLLLAFLLAACGGGGGGGSSGSSGGTKSGTGGGDPGGGDPPPGGTSMSAAEEALAHEVLDILNDERAAQGLDPLVFHVEASDVAYAHCVDMDERDFFSHTNPDGDSPGARLAAAGIANSGWGENIAYGYGTPASVMVAWMNSSGHRANILNSRWTHVGIGVHVAPGGPWWTQVFLRLP
jgi:uncharacterized protein YkwD